MWDYASGTWFHPTCTGCLNETVDDERLEMKFWHYDSRDVWKIFFIVIMLIYGIYDNSGVMVFFGSGALVSWAVQMFIIAAGKNK